MTIAILGALVLDRYIILEDFPQDDTMVFSRHQFDALGGSGTNIAVNLAVHGVKPHLFCGIGQDEIGKQLLKELSVLEVKTHFTSRGVSCTTLVLLNKYGERRIISLGGNALYLDRHEKRYENFGVICVADSYPEEAYKAFNTKSKLKVYVPGGCGLYLGQNTIKKIAGQADITVLSKVEADKIQEYEKISQTVIVTQGKAPTRLFIEGNLRAELSVEQVKDVVDTTGAGDAFVSGLIYSLASNSDIFQAIHLGHQWASKVIKKLGANLGISPFREDELFEFRQAEDRKTNQDL